MNNSRHVMLRVVDYGYGFRQDEVGQDVELVNIIHHEPEYFTCTVKDSRGFTRKTHHNSFGVSFSELRTLQGNMND